MKTSKQQNTRKKLAQTRKCWNVKSSMKNWTRKNRKSLISQRLFEKRSILQVLNLKSVQKRIKGSQQIVESVTLPPAPTSMKEPDSTETSMVESMKNVTEPTLGCKKQRLPFCSENPQATSAMSMLKKMDKEDTYKIPKKTKPLNFFLL